MCTLRTWQFASDKALDSGLAHVHAEDVLHRDIKPGNVFVRRRDGQPVLLDFGAAKEDFSKHSKSRAPHTPGYAAPEQAPDQVEGSVHLGPWTDVYAVGALMWRVATGSVPPSAESRSFALVRGRADPLVIDERTGAGRFSAGLLAVMRECLHLDEARRPQSAKALLALLEGEVDPVRPDPPPPPPPPPPPAPDGDKGKPLPPVVWAAVGAVCALGLGLWLSSQPWSPSPPVKPAPVPAPSPVSVPAKESAPPRPVAERAVGTVFRDALKDGGQGPAMVVLPTGSFRMGSPSGETDRDSDEGPVRMVNISQRIAMGRYEVTFADYDRFVAATSGRRPNDRGWGRGSRPVINVNWNEAKAYATWLSAQTGKRYRLPSESEWEYAARSGTSTRYSWGDGITHEHANYGKDECCDGWASGRDKWVNTAPVGSFEPNPFGLYDMHGNVWEWVEDCYHNNYEGAPTDGSAWTSGCGSDVRAVVRGGSWYNYPQYLRSANRDWLTPSSRYFNFGFRLVQDINP